MPRRRMGIKRPYPIQVDVTKEEDELIARDSFDVVLTKCAYIRRALFSGWDWKAKLLKLRSLQKGIPNVWSQRKAHRSGKYRKVS